MSPRAEMDPLQARCLNAVEDALAFLRRDGSAPQALEALKKRFCSAGSLLEAGAYELEQSGLTAGEARLLSLVPGFARQSLRSRFSPHPKLENVFAATELLKALFLGIPFEQFFVLNLDASGRLISTRLLGRGTLDETPFYLGDLLKCVVEEGAQAVILSHDHPGGTLQPSRADLDCTREAAQALELLGVALIDHIIIADGRGVSFRQNGLLPMAPGLCPALNRRWLKDGK